MRTLPKVNTLQEALQTVIKSNISDNYTPRRFIQIVSNTKSSDLVQVCTELILSKSAFSEMSNALLKYPTLLTMEDFISRQGGEWGFCEDTIDTAKQSALSFDELVKNQRYL